MFDATRSGPRPGSNTGHRVKGYRGGELERRYESLGIAEDAFVNHGFVRAFAGRSDECSLRARSAYIHDLGVSRQFELTGTSLDESGKTLLRVVDEATKGSRGPI
jgi:hypothetical protein